MNFRIIRKGTGDYHIQQDDGFFCSWNMKRRAPTLEKAIEILEGVISKQLREHSHETVLELGVKPFREE